MIINDIESIFKKEKLFKKKDRVLAGVSGGPDSVFLLHCLLKLKKEYSLEINIAHINHCTRSGQSDLDEKFVCDLAQRFKLPFFSLKADVKKFARKEKISFEQAARVLRYDFFQKTAKKLKIKKLVLAHTKNDQVETVIMRILRGTGLKGLVGIKRLNKYDSLLVVRPLLSIEKADLVEYLKKNKIRSRIDKSNFTRDYFRNKVRLDLIPELMKLSPSLNENICRLAFNAAAVEDFLNGEVKKVFKKAVKRNNDNALVLDRIYYLKQHPAVRMELIRKVIFDLCGNLNNIDFKHVEIAEDFIGSLVFKGKHLDLPHGINMYKTRDKVKFMLAKDVKGEAKPGSKRGKQWRIRINEKIVLDQLGYAVSVEKVNRKIRLRRPEASKTVMTEYLDFDKIKLPLIIRTRKPGDVFQPLGLKGKKKLKSFFIDRKIDEHNKDLIPLVLSGGEIAVVGFMRISERFKVTDNTRSLLKIVFKKL